MCFGWRVVVGMGQITVQGRNSRSCSTQSQQNHPRQQTHQCRRRCPHRQWQSALQQKRRGKKEGGGEEERGGKREGEKKGDSKSKLHACVSVFVCAYRLNSTHSTHSTHLTHSTRCSAQISFSFKKNYLQISSRIIAN